MHFVETKGILSSGNGINVYRGCLHGCIYCDTRSECYGFTHPFDDIEVKQNAPELLKAKLRSKRRRCMIGTGSMCDPYMPCEKELKITRRCLEAIRDYEFGAAVITKSDLVMRDLDILAEINYQSKAVVQMTLTTYDDNLCRMLEPNVCPTSRRFEVLMNMKEAGIPTVVWLTPILPFINDTNENIEGLLDYCVNAGVKGIVIWNIGLTLRAGSREYFYQKVDELFPGMSARYQRTFGNAYELRSERNTELMEIVKKRCDEHQIMCRPSDVFDYLRKFPEEKHYEQLSFL